MLGSQTMGVDEREVLLFSLYGRNKLRFEGSDIVE